MELAIVLSFPPPDQPELELRAEDFIFAESPAFAVPGPTVEDATFSVAENSPEGTTVGSVVATDIEITDDPEDSDRLTYEIISGNPDPDVDETPAFSIDAETGAITVADSGDLDFEATPNSFDLTVRVTDLEGLTAESTVTINLTDVNEAPTDGNGDGTPDVEQPNVASIRSLDNPNEFFTLVAPEGVQFTNVSVTDDFDGDGNPDDLNDPTGLGFAFLDGFLNYTIQLEQGQRELDISIILPPNTDFNTYYKFGPTPDNSTPRLYEFTYDGQTGAEFFNLEDGTTLVVLHFIDGERGDNDGEVNGVILDPGAPGVDANLPAPSLEREGESFTIDGTNGLVVPLNFTLTENESAFVNEIGVFRVDDAQGSVNGILPGEDGYSDAALDSNRGEVIFSEVDTDLTGLSRSLQFSGGGPQSGSGAKHRVA